METTTARRSFKAYTGEAMTESKAPARASTQREPSPLQTAINSLKPGKVLVLNTNDPSERHGLMSAARRAAKLAGKPVDIYWAEGDVVCVSAT